MNYPSRTASCDKRGAILVLTVLLLPILLGGAGIVVDTGSLYSAHRRVRNAADAAATAAAMDLLRGRSTSAAIATGQMFATQYNGLSEATVAINIPPTTGPYAGDSKFVEAQVSLTVRTYLIQILGVSSQQTVSGRAVAGLEPVTAGSGVIALSPTARPGLSVSGSGRLVLDSRVVVNSEGGGVDENGAPINNGNNGTAASVSNNGTLRATDIQIVGGVNDPDNFDNYDPEDPENPLHCRALPEPDPLLHLPVPTLANGASSTVWGEVSVSNGQNVTLSPGIYTSISITGGTVTFQPGIYILKPANNTNTTLKITGGSVTGNGVMFYNTGSTFDVTTGLPDSQDTYRAPPATDNARFGGVTINSSIVMTPMNDAANPFNNLVFYQRRLNTQAIQIEGNSSDNQISGTLYAPWAPLKLSGQGAYDAQFIVGEVSITGTADLTINYAGRSFGKANQVFLVE